MKLSRSERAFAVRAFKALNVSLGGFGMDTGDETMALSGWLEAWKYLKPRAHDFYCGRLHGKTGLEPIVRLKANTTAPRRSQWPTHGGGK